MPIQYRLRGKNLNSQRVSFCGAAAHFLPVLLWCATGNIVDFLSAFFVGFILAYTQVLASGSCRVIYLLIRGANYRYHEQSYCASVAISTANQELGSIRSGSCPGQPFNALLLVQQLNRHHTKVATENEIVVPGLGTDITSQDAPATVLEIVCGGFGLGCSSIVILCGEGNTTSRVLAPTQYVMIRSRNVRRNLESARNDPDYLHDDSAKASQQETRSFTSWHGDIHFNGSGR